MLNTFFSIVGDKISGRKKDYFLHAKYHAIKEYYGETVLDVGSGNGDFSMFLVSQSHRVKAIDVTNGCQHSSLDFRLFDGQTIPLDDKSITTSVCHFVLHHTNNQKDLLREMKRVTTDHIIIAEDIINNKFDELLGKIHLNTAPWAKGDNSFRTNEGWMNLFEELGLKLVAAEIINRSDYPVYPVQRIVYVLVV